MVLGMNTVSSTVILRDDRDLRCRGRHSGRAQIVLEDQNRLRSLRIARELNQELLSRYTRGKEWALC